MHIDTMNAVIAGRRSVFPQDYSGERVDDAIVHQILENANWAPTHKFTEPWRFIIYTGDGIGQLAQSQAAYYKQYTTADGTFREERYNNLLTKPLLSSHIIVVGMHRDPKHGVPEVEEIGAVFCAVQNMYLTAAAYGIGAYLSTGGITYFDGANELFGWGPEDKLIGFFHLGMPAKAPLPGRRKPIDEKVRWVR
ncbi:MAG: nitroreductase [Bacteroidia bacterium]|nr:nitroreductase [Bacteroidia bacterium]